MEASALSAPVGLTRLTLAGPLLRLRTDDQLLALFRAGHDEAFGVIHDRYRQRILAYTRQMLGGSRSDAEDAAQDVFLRAWAALRADDRPVALRAWLYRVAHNRCIDQLRRPVPPPADVVDAACVSRVDPAAEVQRRDDLRRLVADMGRLPEQQRSALLMRELDGLSYLELADALQTTVPAIKSLLVRARIGLVEAVEARETACADVRRELAAAESRGVRASGLSRRHVRDCTGCREYRGHLRQVSRGLAAVSPGPHPLGLLAKLFGGGAAAAGGGAATGGGALVLGGGAAAGAGAKVAAVVCCAAITAGGAIELRREARVAGAPAPAASPAPRHPASPAVPPRVGREALGPKRSRAGSATRSRTAGRPAAGRPARRQSAADVRPAAKAPISPHALDSAPAVAAPATGGVLAPEEAPPVVPTGALSPPGAVLEEQSRTQRPAAAPAGSSTAPAGSTTTEATASGSAAGSTGTAPPAG